MTTTPKLNLDQLAGSIVRCFPSLILLEQRLSLDVRNEAEPRSLAHHATPPSNGRLVEKVAEIGEQSCRLLLGDEMTAALDPERP